MTVYLFENYPDELWGAEVPGAPRKTVRMIAGHVHNARCMWLKLLGRKTGLTVPDSVDGYRVTRPELLRALGRSGPAVAELIETARMELSPPSGLGSGEFPLARAAWRSDRRRRRPP